MRRMRRPGISLSQSEVNCTNYFMQVLELTTKKDRRVKGTGWLNELNDLIALDTRKVQWILVPSHRSKSKCPSWTPFES
jgi:hypothetical protein